MKEEKQEQRRRQIERAAFKILASKGYRRASMLQIAKQANASNETLYTWYGNKQALFKSIIEHNGMAVREWLESSTVQDTDPLDTLEALGPLLLRFTTDSKAIVMNRAAIADATETGVLAKAIEEVARGVMYPQICLLMERLAHQGTFTLDCGASDAADSYVALLFGEIQMQLALGTMKPLKAEQIEHRASRAFDLVCRLYKTKAT